MTRREILSFALLPNMFTANQLRKSNPETPANAGVTFSITVNEIPPQIIRVNVQELQLQVDCRNERDVAIVDLRMEEVQIRDHGVDLKVKDLYVEDLNDISIAFVFDTTCSQNYHRSRQIKDAETVLEHLLRDRDECCVVIVGDNFIQAAHHITSTSDFERLFMLRNANPSRDVELARVYPKVHDGTPLVDGMLYAIDKLLEGSVERKALIMFTDGIDVGSIDSISHVNSSIVNARIPIYLFCYSDPSFYRTNAALYAEGRRSMQLLVQDSGGQFFAMDHIGLTQATIVQINEELRREYRILCSLPDKAPFGVPEIILHRAGSRIARTTMEIEL